MLTSFALITLEAVVAFLAERLQFFLPLQFQRKQQLLDIIILKVDFLYLHGIKNIP